MKFYTWTAAQKGAKGLCTRDWNFFWFSNFNSTAFMSAFLLWLHLRDPCSLVLQPQHFLYQPRISVGETLCQKLHFMYYGRPFREYSCVINFHFKAKSSWNDVRELGGLKWCTFKWEEKNKINKKTHRRQYHAVAHNKNMHLKNLSEPWAPTACTQASSLLPLHTRKHTHTHM